MVSIFITTSKKQAGLCIRIFPPVINTRLYICIQFKHAHLHYGTHVHACADPESFARGGRTLTGVFFFFSWWGEEGSKYHHKRAIIGPPPKRHLNGVSLACRCWPNIECWLGIFVLFQGIRTSIAKKPYTFVIFQGGVGLPAAPSSLDPHMMLEKP